MVDWIHCNGCYRQPGVGKQFSLTNCGHIFCQDCLGTDINETCKVCDQVFRSQPLTSEMNPEVAVYFTEPSELIQKYLKQLDQIIQVVDFQRNHHRRLTVHNHEKMLVLDVKMAEASSAVERMQKMEMDMLRLQKELEAANKEISYLRHLIKSYKARKSPNFSLRASGDMPLNDSGAVMSSVPGLTTLPEKTWKGSLEAPESFSLNLLRKVPSSGFKQTVPQFSFCTPTTVTHISPGLGRLSVRTPPSNGRLGEIPRYPASGNQALYSSPMPSVRGSPNYAEADEDKYVSQVSKILPKTDRLLARFQVNYPNLKP